MNEQLKMINAHQLMRQKALGILREKLKEAEDVLYDVADDCLEEAGFLLDFEKFEAGDAEEVDSWGDKQTELIEDVIRNFHASEIGPIWAMLSWQPDFVRLDLEFFSGRPKTANGDPDAWPEWFRVYCGNLDGGDSVQEDSRGGSFG